MASEEVRVHLWRNRVNSSGSAWRSEARRGEVRANRWITRFILAGDVRAKYERRTSGRFPWEKNLNSGIVTSFSKDESR